MIRCAALTLNVVAPLAACSDHSAHSIEESRSDVGTVQTRFLNALTSIAETARLGDPDETGRILGGRFIAIGPKLVENYKSKCINLRDNALFSSTSYKFRPPDSTFPVLQAYYSAVEAVDYRVANSIKCSGIVDETVLMEFPHIEDFFCLDADTAASKFPKLTQGPILPDTARYVLHRTIDRRGTFYVDISFQWLKTSITDHKVCAHAVTILLLTKSLAS